MDKKPTWSFSQFKSFEQCPKQFYHTTVLKQYPYVESASQRRGKALHAAFEHHIDRGMDLPPQFETFQPIMDSVAAMPGKKLVEHKFGLTEDFEITGFFAKNVWFRGVVDLAAVGRSKAKVLDYKTGTNTRYADVRQIELMALGLFAEFPNLERVSGGLVYVDVGEFISKSVSADDVPKLKRKWLAEYDMILAAHESDTWNPKPSGLCKRHCQVVECPHNGANN